MILEGLYVADRLDALPVRPRGGALVWPRTCHQLGTKNTERPAREFTTRIGKRDPQSSE